MKAILYPRYGPPDVLELREVEKPVPKEDQVLVRVHAASANAADWRRFASLGLLPRLMGGGLLTPKDPRIGVDIAGKVEAVGSNVTEFKAGDEIFGLAPGAFAEYACANRRKVALKPANLSFAAAAAIPVAALTALQGLRDKGRVQPGQRVLIYGAGGGVGTFAVQVAKALGAEVTAVCGPHNVEVMRSLGADHVVDYSKTDALNSGRRYDLILAVNGDRPILHYRRALSPKGIYLAAGGSLSQILSSVVLGPALSQGGGKKMGFMGIAQANQTDLDHIRQMTEAGKLMPVIDRTYPLSQTAEAIRYLVQEHARGKVIITIA